MVFLAFTQHFSLPLTNPVLIFSLILFIILFAPLLLNRLNIPHLIGLIIAGNLMNRDSSIILFGTVGLLYIMFLAGLEIDMEEFLKNKWKSIYFGLLTFSIPMFLGTYGALYVLGYRQSSAILLASMFASHTLLAYPIISKMGLARNKIVGIAIGGTMITDTLALMVLAIIVGVSHGTVDATFWWRLGISFTIATIIILIGFPILARWFLKKYSDNISQYIFILALVFLGGFMAELAGLEAIIGAFMAGLSLNKLIPRTSSLMNRIEFVGNALFIPFFLIGVGMLINVAAFFNDWETIKVAAFMVSVALAAKYLAAWITQKTL
ncbi:MAG: cation:proton antiporter, partial [Candidatus Paceibacteria bacterium]